MCCFSGKVEEVKNTRIFARMGANGNQVLIYQMSLKSAQDVAMVLPIPVKPVQGEKAVTFFDFQRYPNLFEDLDEGFPATSASYSNPFGAVPASAPSMLKVVSVGAYDASYVPSIADFSRLDEQFRLPENVWSQLPGYKDFGFAVFKLKSGNAEVHPMAFSFPSAWPNEIFFPTLHIHDGKIHKKEHFDHTLYCQATEQDLRKWDESPRLAVSFAKCGLTHGMLKAEQHVYRRTLQGNLTNSDLIVKSKVG